MEELVVTPVAEAAAVAPVREQRVAAVPAASQDSVPTWASVTGGSAASRAERQQTTRDGLVWVVVAPAASVVAQARPAVRWGAHLAAVLLQAMSRRARSVGSAQWVILWVSVAAAHKRITGDDPARETILAGAPVAAVQRRRLQALHLRLQGADLVQPLPYRFRRESPALLPKALERV